MIRAEKKVPGGKLVRLAIDMSGQTARIRLSGDFFVHPEEGIFEIEELLAGLPVDEPADRVKDVIDNHIMARKLELIGIDSETIAQLFTECFQCGE
ncbi:hypothetical protein [Methanocella arvoryzae]|uniref:Lipoate-protein ligase A, N-terminal n=1 Tax=Methanocella arvoryzae (strain DSM 22066 / NBRC 105507 / MRE50) TaxID=351160 RepID=Q0W156_METAR|nr:hypothetical protein [Methanocella arvoryzae]CAJ37887.1 lipoate-protein ligase A, N-terminal fragment [Methanocella arvoryzae MRE50]